MLTGDLVRPRMKWRGTTLRIDMVDVTDKHWGHTADDLIRLFAQHINHPRREWSAALEKYEGERLDYIVIRGLAKVLEDAATFAPLEAVISPTDLREKLFAHGPAFSTGDLFKPQTRDDLLSAVAAEYQVDALQVERLMFADRPGEYLLREIDQAWAPESLLARYNLELARGVLYWATEMRVEIHDNYKDFWRYLKLFKLMFEAKPLQEGGYLVRLDGPISPFVSSTTRYGRQFAAFLPALFLGKQWRMSADIQMRAAEGSAVYALDNTSPLQSHFKYSGLFDSKLEEDFARQFEDKFGDERGQWRLNREDEVLMVEDTVFIPDFSITHKKDGRRALVEIVGFWHPDYLRRKLAKIQGAGLKNMVLLIYERTNLTPDRLVDIPGEVLYFPSKPVLKDVMAAVEHCAL